MSAQSIVNKKAIIKINILQFDNFYKSFFPSILFLMRMCIGKQLGMKWPQILIIFYMLSEGGAYKEHSTSADSFQARCNRMDT